METASETSVLLLLLELTLEENEKQHIHLGLFVQDNTTKSRAYFAAIVLI